MWFLQNVWENADETKHNKYITEAEVQFNWPMEICPWKQTNKQTNHVSDSWGKLPQSTRDEGFVSLLLFIHQSKTTKEKLRVSVWHFGHVCVCVSLCVCVCSLNTWCHRLLYTWHPCSQSHLIHTKVCYRDKNIELQTCAFILKNSNHIQQSTWDKRLKTQHVNILPNEKR